VAERQLVELVSGESMNPEDVHDVVQRLLPFVAAGFRAPVSVSKPGRRRLPARPTQPRKR
jgi:hypothetical protein